MNVFTLMGKVVIDAANAKEEIDNVTSGAEKSQGKIISAFKKIGTAVATYFAVSKIVDFGKSLVSLASSAEDAAAKVNTLLAAGTDTAKYFNDMLAASSQTGIAMADFSEAVYASISASVDQADAVTFAADAVKLAKAGFTETATAVDVLTTAINAYGLSSSDATHISDVLITTQNLGKTTVDELASSMGKVIPLASAYGVNLENLAAGYAVLTKGGIATAEATTYQKSMLTELADSGSNVAKILKKQTKQSFSDLMNAGYSLGDVLQILYESTGNNTTAFANLWSSTEAGTGALALVNAGVDEFNQTLDSMTDSANATEAAYAEVTSTFSEQVKRLKTNLQNVGIQIANKFLPALTSIVSTVADKVEPAFQLLADGVASARDALPTLQAKFQTISAFLTKTFSPAVTKIQQLFTRVKDAIAPLVTKLQEFVSQVSEYVSSGDAASDATDLLQSAFEALASGVETVVDGILAFSDWCAAHQGTIQTLAVIIGSFTAAWLIFNAAVTAWNVIGAIATAATTAFGAAVNFLTAPVTLVIAAIGALIAIVALCITHWDDIKAAAVTAWNWIKSTWEKASEWFNENVTKPVTQFFTDLWTGISTWASDTWDAIKEVWKKVSEWFDTYVITPVTEFFSTLWTSASTAASSAWDAIKAVWEKVSDWFDTYVIQPISSLWEKLKGILSPINTSVNVTTNTRTVSQARADGLSDQEIHAGLASGDITVNAKGAVFSRATIFDTRLGKQMVGEAGPEAVAPISVLQGYVADAVNSSNSTMVSLLGQILDAVQGQGTNMEEQMTRAFSSMRFDVNNREFARLVKAVT